MILSNIKDGISMMVNFPSDQNEIKDRIRNVIVLATSYGNYPNIDLSQWVIDQTIRELLGTQYWEFVQKYEAGAGRPWLQGKSLDQIIEDKKKDKKDA